MITSEEFKKIIDYVFEAHQLQTNNHGSKTRQNEQVPFVVHPYWCALILLNDKSIPQKERELGFCALMLHDVLEDTNMPLPPNTPQNVSELVADMTYENWEEEKREVLKKSVFLQLLKVVDKISTIYDTPHDYMPPEKKNDWRVFTEKLLQNVEPQYGKSQLFLIAKSIVDNSGW